MANYGTATYGASAYGASVEPTTVTLADYLVWQTAGGTVDAQGDASAIVGQVEAIYAEIGATGDVFCDAGIATEGSTLVPLADYLVWPAAGGIVAGVGGAALSARLYSQSHGAGQRPLRADGRTERPNTARATVDRPTATGRVNRPEVKP